MASVIVDLEAGTAPASAHAALEAEAVYDELLDHVHACRHCWERREALWRADRLCATGRNLIAAYASAVVVASTSAQDADAALAVRFGVEPAPRPVVLAGGAG